jgi:hypothetical protein
LLRFLLLNILLSAVVVEVEMVLPALQTVLAAGLVDLEHLVHFR